MESLSNSYIFNAGGWLTTVFAFFGAKTTNMMEYYPLLTFIIALLSIIFLFLRLFLTYQMIMERHRKKIEKEESTAKTIPKRIEKIVLTHKKGKNKP